MDNETSFVRNPPAVLSASYDVSVLIHLNEVGDSHHFVERECEMIGLGREANDV